MTNTNNDELEKRLLDLVIDRQLEVSTHYIDFFELQIKLRRHEINKKWWFQKRKIKNSNEKIIKLEQEIREYYKKINRELKELYCLDAYKKYDLTYK